MIKKRCYLFAAVLAGMSMAASSQTSIDSNFPNNPVRFFAAFPAGGVTDIVARIIAPELSQRLGQPVIVDNRAGAGGVGGRGRARGS